MSFILGLADDLQAGHALRVGPPPAGVHGPGPGPCRHPVAVPPPAERVGCVAEQCLRGDHHVLRPGVEHPDPRCRVRQAGRQGAGNPSRPAPLLIDAPFLPVRHEVDLPTLRPPTSRGVSTLSMPAPTAPGWRRGARRWCRSASQRTDDVRRADSRLRMVRRWPAPPEVSRRQCQRTRSAVADSVSGSRVRQMFQAGTVGHPRARAAAGR